MPANVFWFEALLYLSLTLDALSVAFQDRTPTADTPERAIMAGAVVNGCTILLLTYLVWLAACRRKSWPRWVLGAMLLISILALTQVIGDRGVELDSGIEVISCIVTAAGLYLSYTGDAKGWFNG